MLQKKGITIKFAIIVLAVFTAFSATITNWYISNNSLRNTLIENRLENNYRYAQKVSISTSVLLNDMEQNLRTLAEIIGQQEFSQSDLDHWYAASSQYYNSLFTTDSDGTVQLMSPQVVPNNQNSVQPGTKIKSDLMKQALQEQKPFISNPYLAQTGNLVVLLSYPIFDTAGNYKGVVDGTIYLESESSLNGILNEHEFLNESSVFVVDRKGNIIYHPDVSRINESVADHPLIQSAIQGKSGSSQIINNRGTEYFSGYASVEETGWGIITQTPSSVIEAPLRTMTQKMIVQSLPLLVLIIWIAWIFTNRLTKPINKLAQFSKEATLTKKTPTAHNLEFKSSIYEVRQLCQYIQKHIQLLNKQVHRDGLTGLYNRRSFDLQIEELVHQKIPFSLIMLDIDNFKKVNDKYGHLVGDDVLRFLALTMKDMSREEDLCYRYGGEEFTILLTEKNRQEAFTLAERLRTKIAETPSPTGQPITISLGISTYQEENHKPEEVIKKADTALYQSKNEGRNQTTVYKEA
ncbi:sensor domain-containing diguanylate cyclase [Oceanobacillus saliphilus]|uniref:sensor domain-containing diguanylate cyclase n=1 Tax=Oceanobacillus saliphilus TaxID=2925834 RepID=UPI00201DA9BE|nr:sensor domain-containing diguanylate cyclase [Oceanobacillus saliphilus]